MPDCQTSTSCVKRHRTRCIIIRVVEAFDCEKIYTDLNGTIRWTGVYDRNFVFINSKYFYCINLPSHFWQYTVNLDPPNLMSIRSIIFYHLYKTFRNDGNKQITNGTEAHVRAAPVSLFKLAICYNKLIIVITNLSFVI